MRALPRRWCPVPALLVLIGLGGCLELVPVEPPAQVPANLQLTVQIAGSYGGVQTGDVAIPVTGLLDPGVDGRGRPHEVVGDSIWIWGRALPMHRIGPRGRMALTDTLWISASTIWEEPIDLRPPAIAGIPEVPASLTWSRVRGVGPDTLVVASGEPVSLKLYVSEPGSGPEPRIQRWGVSVYVTGRWFGFGEEGPPPSVIRIPPELLGEGATGTFSVSAFVDQIATLPHEHADYRLNLALHQQLRWAVRVVPPEQSDESPARMRSQQNSGLGGSSR